MPSMSTAHDDGRRRARRRERWCRRVVGLGAVSTTASDRPLLPGVYMLRRRTTHDIVYIGMAGERRERGFVVGSPPTAVDVAPCLELDLRR